MKSQSLSRASFGLVQRPLSLSLIVHFGFALFVGALINSQFRSSKSQVELTVFYPEQAIKSPVIEQIQARSAPKVDPKKSVYGLSRKAITEDQSDVTTKQGNTLAKQRDEKVLNEDDPDSLPIPTDEYLLTQMPVVKREVRARYPDEARRNRVEGAVVLDVLIDRAGLVREARVLEGLGYGTEAAALEAIRQFEFSPGMMGEKSVAVRIRYLYRFVLE